MMAQIVNNISVVITVSRCHYVMIFLQKFAPYCRCTLAVILLDRHAAGTINLGFDAGARVRRAIRFFSSHGGC